MSFCALGAPELGAGLKFFFPASGLLSPNAKQNPMYRHVRGNRYQKANAQYLEDTILGKVAFYSNDEFSTIQPFRMLLGGFRRSPCHCHGHHHHLAVVGVILYLYIS